MADGSGFLPAAVEAAAFKEGMSRWATGVAIATCRFEGTPHGLAISSFTSVSAAPPRVLFCLAKSSRSSLAFRHALEVGVGLLPDEAEPLALRFSGGAEPNARFDADAWDLDPRSPPRLRGALAHFRGIVRSRLDAGSHEVLVVDVQQVALGDGAPLIYARRGYRRLAQSDLPGETAGTASRPPDWTEAAA